MQVTKLNLGQNMTDISTMIPNSPCPVPRGSSLPPPRNLKPPSPRKNLRLSDTEVKVERDGSVVLNVVAIIFLFLETTSVYVDLSTIGQSCQEAVVAA